MNVKSWISPNLCPLCNYTVGYSETHDPINDEYIITAYCKCTSARRNFDEATILEAPTPGKRYCYEMVWNLWKNAVDKKLMTPEKKNPDSEETGAMDSDAVWDAVLRAMIDCYELGGEDKQHDYCKRYRPARTDAFFETLLKEKLNGL